jgi:hypothetical protein
MKKRLMTIGILMLTASLAVNAGPNHHRFQDTAGMRMYPTTNRGKKRTRERCWVALSVV